MACRNFFINLLTGTIPSTLGSLSRLMTMQFYNNSLTGTVPSTLSRLTNLTKL